MTRLDKSYFTLAETLDRWQLGDPDLLYLVENGDLTLSIRAIGLPVQRGTVAFDEHGQCRPAVDGVDRIDGPIDLSGADAATILKHGARPIRYFAAEYGQYRECLLEPIVVDRIDLVVRKEERDRVELIHGLGDRARTAAELFRHAADYSELSLGDLKLRLGPLQAGVVAILHQAHASDCPWRHGKELLAVVGSASMRLSDLFKSKPGWRKLIRSDGRGRYRLAIPHPRD